jgi:hypothetical protein
MNFLKTKPSTECAVYLTDGFGYFPSETPKQSTLGSTYGCPCDDSAFFPNGSPYGLPCASLSLPFPKVSILASAPTLDSV